MDTAVLETLAQRKRLQVLRLNEIQDLSRQLAEALTRKDEVSAKMLLTMRQDPLEQVDRMETELQAYLHTLPEEDAIRAQELLRGAQAQTPDESLLCQQVAHFRRALDSTIQLDKRLNLQVAGNKSIYKMYR